MPRTGAILATMAQPYIGGQAVIEGVMMRAPACLTVAVRRPDGTIALREGPYRSRWSKKLWKLPGFRGVAMLVESMTMGFSALQFSAEQQMTEEELAQDQGSGRLAVVVSTLLALGLFVALPQGLASLAARGAGWDLGLTDTGFHVLIGGFKLLIFVGYLLLISRIPDVRRLFQYHGAEHKTIHAYEKQLPLTVENVQAQTTLHPRCGTTFLVVVIVVSIILGSLVAPVLMPKVGGWMGQVALLVIRIGLLPIIAAISYELQRLSARFCTTGWRRMVLYPGFLFQKITDSGARRRPGRDRHCRHAGGCVASGHSGERAPRRRADCLCELCSLQGSIERRGFFERLPRRLDMLPTDKLESLAARYREIEELLCQPNVMSEAGRYKGLTKERAELQQVVEAYGRYVQVVEDLAGHRQALSDPDLRELAADEIPALERERARLEESINLLLLPKDINDERNTILEIRSGTGGRKPLFSPRICSGCIADTRRRKVGKSRSCR